MSNSSSAKTFGTSLRELRESLGLSITAAAARAGLTAQTVMHVESDAALCSTAFQYCRGLGRRPHIQVQRDRKARAVDLAAASGLALAEESTPTTPELSAAEQERERVKAWLASDAGQKASPQARMAAADLLSMNEQRAEKSAKNIAFERYLANKVKSYRDWESWSPERKNLECISARAEFDAARKGETTQ